MGQDRWVIVCVVVVLSFLFPLSLCLAVACLEAQSFVALAVGCAAAGVWMALLSLVNWWEFTSRRLRWIWSGILLVIAIWRLRSASNLVLVGPTRAGLAATVILAAVGIWLLAGALAARRCRGDAVDLSFPLRDGRFLITDGGDGARSFLVNYHYGFGRHRASGVSRSMRYAVDIVEIGPGGGESRGFLPCRNDAYRVWGRPLHAPCDGRIAHAVNDVRDNAAFGKDRPYGLGNHVVIRKAPDTYVVLGHMRQGSVVVKPGDIVQAGQKIGCVGNSGWTERPHVHMQAMRGTDGKWWQGEPLALRFAGRFMVRNQSVRN